VAVVGLQFGGVPVEPAGQAAVERGWQVKLSLKPLAMKPSEHRQYPCSTLPPTQTTFLSTQAPGTPVCHGAQGALGAGGFVVVVTAGVVTGVVTTGFSAPPAAGVPTGPVVFTLTCVGPPNEGRPPPCCHCPCPNFLLPKPCPTCGRPWKPGPTMSGSTRVTDGTQDRFG
jgi:hypothetical protein